MILIISLLPLAILARLLYKERKIEPLLEHMSYCTQRMAKAIDRGEWDEAERWKERFDETREMAQPMVDSWI